MKIKTYFLSFKFDYDHGKPVRGMRGLGGLGGGDTHPTPPRFRNPFICLYVLQHAELFCKMRASKTPFLERFMLVWSRTYGCHDFFHLDSCSNVLFFLSFTVTDFKNASGQGFPCSTSRCPGRRQWNGHGGWKQSKAWNEVEGTWRKSGNKPVSYFPAFDRHCMAYCVFQPLLEIIWTFSLKAYLLKASKFHIAWLQVRLLLRIFRIFFQLRTTNVLV